VRRESIKRVRLVVLTSDRGLCGPFNNQLLRRTVDWLDERKAEGVEVEVHVYGRKGRDFLNSRKVAIAQTVLDLSQKDRLELVREIADAGVAAFAAGEVDQVVVAYNKFVNTLTQRPTFSQVVPVSVPAGSGEDALVDYLYEPGPAALFANLLPLYLRTQILQSVLETEAGEHAARMAAMDSATKNANDLINRLTLVYNRARQAAITTEITEIVSGAEAL
jgi:F-type H+-transporting ATPase subunit gamma